MKSIRFKQLCRGFTLIELMITVAIIGILASIAIPKFASLVRKSKEGATKGNLGTIRSAMTIYYADMEGQYPNASNFPFTNDALIGLTVNGKYLTALPIARTPDYHTDTTAEKDWQTMASDSSGWLYDANVTDTFYGTLRVNCSHTDTQGTVWTTY